VYHKKISKKGANVINEMARRTRSHAPGSFLDMEEYEKYKDLGVLELVKDNIGSQKYKFYKVGNEIFYLTDKNDNPVGIITGDTQGTDFEIWGTEKDPKVKGFYGMMFPLILNHTKIKNIYSGTLLSPSAAKVYDKLDKSNSLVDVYIKTPEGVKKYNSDLLFQDPKNRVLVTQDKQFLKEHFDKIDRIQKDPLKFRNFFIEGNENADIYTFGDRLENLP
jgi:hypothetical protein